MCSGLDDHSTFEHFQVALLVHDNVHLPRWPTRREKNTHLSRCRSLFRNIRDEAKSAGPLKWTVKRDSRYLVPTVLELIRTDAAGPALRQALRITFEGEAGVDEGGILSEVTGGVRV